MAPKNQVYETARCFSLVFLSLLLLPFSTSVACICLVVKKTRNRCELATRPQTKAQDGSFRKTVLVTGVGMAKGLALARSFCLSGHRVIGADFEGCRYSCPGRYSQSLSAFYPLPITDSDDATKTYLQELTKIVKTERVDIWVSCSGVANAIQDAYAKESIEQHTPCKCIQFDAQTTSTLHNKGPFMEECRDKGLPVPETHQITSNHDVTRALSASKTSTPGRRFILKPAGLDDINRGNMTLLPFPSDKDTKSYISRLPISESNPWILQQFIPGGEEYCTHSLVVRGEVKCFVACPSAELLMHYRPLSSISPLWQAMLAFTVEFVQRSPNPKGMTGHLSFDFMVSDAASPYYGTEKNIYAIECNPRAHTAVVLYAQQGPEMEAMVNSYLTAVSQSPKEIRICPPGLDGFTIGTEGPVIQPINTQPRYWIGHDIFSLFIYPLYLWCIGSAHFSRVVSSTLDLSRHLIEWKEGTFELWDPLPAFYLYHVYWPIVILSAWWNGKKWSRINVSTTKMFTC